METGNIEFYRHIYKLDKELKNYSVYHLDSLSSKQLLTDIIRIENDFGRSNGNNFNDWLRLRTSNNWKTCQLITGLRKTSTVNLYFGDCVKIGLIGNKKRTLLLFFFDDYQNKLIIDVFKDFYPLNNGFLLNLIKIHLTN